MNRQNLLAEGHAEQHVHVTGNTVVDALRMMVDRFKKNPDIYEQIEADFASMIDGGRSRNNWCLSPVTAEKISGKAFATYAMRSRNWRICQRMLVSFTRYIPIQMFKCRFASILAIVVTSTLFPLSYEYFCFLLNRAHLILTDSGGVQEEAPSIGKPVLVMRDTTERPEAVSAGTVKLLGLQKTKS